MANKSFHLRRQNTICWNYYGETPIASFSRSAILDRLWEMDWFAVYEILESDPITRSIRVILLTAKVLPSDRAKFAQMAVARVITKPIQPLTLTEEVAEILGWVD